MIEDIFDTSEITITGRYPSLTRIKTGLFSLDYALSQEGNLGLPLRVLVELYGYTNVGKSTLSYYLAGVVSREMERQVIPIADLEMADLNYIPKAVAASGFKGEIRMMDLTDEKGKPYSHEKVLMSLAKELHRETTAAVLWDSIGATQAEVEMDVLLDPKGQFGQAFMGKRAKLVGEISNAIRTALITKETPSTAIAVNHVHSIIGGRGHDTPGGERKKYLAGVRLMLWTKERFYDSEEPDARALGYLVAGQVEKLRFGGGGKKFQFYIIPGVGVHPGVTAMFDAFDHGLAERGARVKLDGKSIGFLKADLLSYAAEGKRRKFYPFQEAITQYATDVENGDVEPEEIDG